MKASEYEGLDEVLKEQKQMSELKEKLQSKFTIEGKGKSLCCSKDINELWQFISDNFVSKGEYAELEELASDRLTTLAANEIDIDILKQQLIDTNKNYDDINAQLGEAIVLLNHF